MAEETSLHYSSVSQMSLNLYMLLMHCVMANRSNLVWLKCLTSILQGRMLDKRCRVYTAGSLTLSSHLAQQLYI